MEVHLELSFPGHATEKLQGTHAITKYLIEVIQLQLATTRNVHRKWQFHRCMCHCMNVHRHIHDVVMEGSPSSTTLTVSRRRGTLMKKGLLYIYIYICICIYIYIYI